jgi:hypothetical protein
MLVPVLHVLALACLMISGYHAVLFLSPDLKLRPLPVQQSEWLSSDFLNFAYFMAFCLVHSVFASKLLKDLWYERRSIRAAQPVLNSQGQLWPLRCSSPVLPSDFGYAIGFRRAPNACIHLTPAS